MATRAVQSVAIAPGGIVEVGVALKNGVAENAGFGVMVAVGVFDGVHVRVAVRVSVMVGVSDAVEVREAVGLIDADGLGKGVAVGYSPDANPGSDRLNVVPSPNWPLPLYPQQYAFPEEVTPHVVWLLTESVVQPVGPTIGVG